VNLDGDDREDIMFWKEILTPQVQLPAAQPQLAQEQEALPQPPAIVVDVELLSWWLEKSVGE
jgi:hypothetical protein